MNTEVETIVTGIALGVLKLAFDEIKEIIENRKKSKAKKRKSRKK